MITKKKTIIIISICILLTIIYIITPCIKRYFIWQSAKAAISPLTYQIGLTSVVITPCFTTGSPPTCEGGPLCFTLDAGRCTLYSDVTGLPAGGMGSNALFLKTAIAQAGLPPGGQLIAGGTGPTLMDSGVLASYGGCYGCYAKVDIFDKMNNWFDKYVIALFKE